ncbi:type II toxin-antitoxin system HigB family toxin [Pseudomonas sp. CCI3.2]|uniref:type II toxin-antitoxin system HigB family toxin n=1 Tax=unclassified Pseudomonas TaxID=196821 RepID=UPI002AC98BD5|nr:MULTISPECIES: type II toxin-antitoxin system HigB family toxin [unclassified Pseudomonas]MEB0076290.1 type II toxin-antitoxin system HigB family toxin [Pseudomonas sp. MH10out]MEB0093706.1 type II toxin-antitoxin system HigB family toxin [Pseudomonas sp. CCI4.2]MEB0101071.1 type II toxin-antitoxin system HigB family toxin [Pseudomonas sp. CCI3.2]MEB0128930.1 type II toxin-antitoxin system HigB family toxin [Pseudomonas sp. CCI2.4]MEB0158621.1 type II toxin-antitoxin system HigB family toxin
MRVIAKRKLVKFREVPGHDDAEASLESWHHTALRAIWKTPQDVKDQIGNASVCGNNRVVFNIGGNKYRLVVEMQYRAGIVWVKFIGNHRRYDEIDVETINEY